MDITINPLENLPIAVHDDSAFIQEQLYQPFAWGDVFLREVNRDPNKIILHIWPMADTLILGMLDRRLPYCSDAIKAVRTHGLRAVVRNVGGLAVIADEGVLNFSFIMAKPAEHKFSINDAYEMMYAFIQKVFEKDTQAIEHFTVEDSYCPGDYDLSIGGKKFAGIAQRRFKDGISISIYLSVCGNQEKRGAIVKEFYQEGKQGEAVNFKFPEVNPASMANLSDLLGKDLDVPQVTQMLLDTLKGLSPKVYDLEVSDTMTADYRGFYDKMIERNRKV